MAIKKTRRPEGTPSQGPAARGAKKTTQGGGGRAAGRGGKGAGAARTRAGSFRVEDDLPLGAVRVAREIGGRTLALETGRMGRQADGAVVVRYGDTMVLASAQSATPRDDIDFFPLTVEYRERAAAAGKFPGGFFKREGRPTTREILTCRIIDRSIRPMFPDGYRNEVQVLSQVLSTDQENDSDIAAAIASFAALAISSIPTTKILGACRIGRKEGELMVNPTWATAQSAENELNLTVAAHREAIVMVEAAASEVPESAVVEALELGHAACIQVVELIEELVALVGKKKQEFTPPAVDAPLDAEIRKRFGKQLRAAPAADGGKSERSDAKAKLVEEVCEALPPPDGASDKEVKVRRKAVATVCQKVFEEAERETILAGKRTDGRKWKDIRPISIEVNVLPRVHGSVLFTRGETQALAVATLGTPDDAQRLDGIYPEPERRFLLHYSFPPFSVGEVRRVGSPGRREIGHGALAERALEAVLPGADQFPYTIRITSDILESNGSSSMASVCGGTMALMDAGVPIKQPVAGIAMGLVMDQGKYAILSDIHGSEDHCGDMDFKVAGTPRGITALQMDIKCEGLTREILEEALQQAREGRIHVLREMLKTLRTPRAEISPNAPRLMTLVIPEDKIGVLIGPGGRNVRAMQEEFETRISIEDNGTVTVAGSNPEKVQACFQRIKDMTAEVEVGTVYKGKVTAIKEFGAFVEILPGQEGLCHVSELSREFIRSVTDVVRIGDEIEVKVIGIDDFGKIKLSRKALLAPSEGDAEREGRGPRGDRERGDRERPAHDRHGRGREREDRDDRGPRGRGGDRRPDFGDRGRHEGRRGGEGRHREDESHSFLGEREMTDAAGSAELQEGFEGLPPPGRDEPGRRPPDRGRGFERSGHEPRGRRPRGGGERRGGGRDRGRHGGRGRG
jgi:polyribonucleotide nucleotidyltransferase